MNEIANKYDSLERSMLDQFYDYARLHQNYKWIHWNMRDSNFGFEAVAHRYRTIGGEPIEIPEAQRHDLTRILAAIYGAKYIGHPKLKKLVERNELTDLDFVLGEDEPKLFSDGEYVQLHQSTLRKTVVIAGIAKKAWLQELKTDTKWWTAHGLSIKAWIETIYDHWLFKAAGIVIALFALVQIVRALGFV